MLRFPDEHFLATRFAASRRFQHAAGTDSAFPTFLALELTANMPSSIAVRAIQATSLKRQPVGLIVTVPSLFTTFSAIRSANISLCSRRDLFITPTLRIRRFTHEVNYQTKPLSPPVCTFSAVVVFMCPTWHIDGAIRLSHFFGHLARFFRTLGTFFRRFVTKKPILMSNRKSENISHWTRMDRFKQFMR